MSPFHAGELEMQERVGVRGMAEKVGNGMRTTMPPPAQEFLSSQPFVVLGGVGEGELVWASLLSGEPGFVYALNENTVQLDALLPAGDPLEASLEDGALLGMIAIEPATRRRMRLNGRGRQEQGSIVIQTQQVYANCPKYIQKREWYRAENEVHGEAQRGVGLQPHQTALIESADTFFIASYAQVGADASHRGGLPGFVKVLSPQVLQFPDYSGNAMFNTLGNLLCDNRAGLLFIDWPTGTTLQLAGQARVLWGEEVAAWPGAERGVELRIERVIERVAATSLRWRFLESSPFNPPL